MLPGEEVVEFAVEIGSLPDDGVGGTDPEDLEEDVGSVEAMVITSGCAGTGEFWADGGLVFVVKAVLEGEAQGARLVY